MKEKRKNKNNMKTSEVNSSEKQIDKKVNLSKNGINSCSDDVVTASSCKNLYILIVFALVSSLLLLAGALSIVSLTRSRDSQVLQSLLQDELFTAEVEQIVKRYVLINYPEDFTRSR